MRVDLSGNVVNPGNTQLGINKATFALHSSIYAARPDVKCVIQLQNTAAVAVSTYILSYARKCMCVVELLDGLYQRSLTDLHFHEGSLAMDSISDAFMI